MIFISNICSRVTDGIWCETQLINGIAARNNKSSGYCLRIVYRSFSASELSSSRSLYMASNRTRFFQFFLYFFYIEKLYFTVKKVAYAEENLTNYKIKSMVPIYIRKIS